jgi:hypothetical protein
LRNSSLPGFNKNPLLQQAGKNIIGGDRETRKI